MVDTVFRRIENSPSHIEYTVSVSFFEIYLEVVKDLLKPSSRKLLIKQDSVRGIYVKDLTETFIRSPEEIHEIMQEGNANRTMAKTSMND